MKSLMDLVREWRAEGDGGEPTFWSAANDLERWIVELAAEMDAQEVDERKSNEGHTYFDEDNRRNELRKLLGVKKGEKVLDKPSATEQK